MKGIFDPLSALRRADDLWKTFEYRIPTPAVLTGCDYVDGKDGELTIYLRAPGYGRDDLIVEAQDGMVRVHGRISEERRPTRLIPEQLDYEFSLGSYQIEEAVHENGILAIRMTRQRKAESTKIPIR